MKEVIIFVVLGMTFILWCIILHEYGHYIYYRLTKKKIDFKMGLFPREEIILNKRQLIVISVAGILAGMLPIIILQALNPWYWILMFFYLFIGCRSDIKNIYEAVRE